MEEVVVAEPSMFKQLLNAIVKVVSIIHTSIMSLNDKYEMFLSDKALHFIVIGLIGMFVLLIVYPFFKWLVEKNQLVSVAWIYTFTILIALTLLIEIGQDFSGTGDMDFGDIVSGLLGFIVMSGISIMVIYGFKYIKNYFNKDKDER